MSEQKVKRKTWRQEDMNEAIKACREQGVSASAAAKSFNVPRKTLTDRLNGKVKSNCQQGAPTALSEEQETTLCKYVEYMAGRGFQLTVNQIIMYAWSIDKSSGRKIFGESGPCYGWWTRFKQRHPEMIKLRRSNFIDGGRALSSTADTLKTYFRLLKEVMDEGKFHERPQDIYNCDETIVDLNKSSQKVVIPRRIRGSRCNHIASSEHITIHCCISAAGFVMPPYIIFKSPFPGGCYTKDGPHGAMYGKQDSGFMDSKHFLKWFEKIFVPHANPTPERSVLLLLDAHLTHCSIPVIEAAKRNNVILMALSPLPFRLCQPLDVAIYESFKPKLIKLIEIRDPIRGDLWTSKTNVPRYIKPPLEESMSPSNITAGFHKCGISPFNPSAINKTQLIRNKLMLEKDNKLTAPVSMNAAPQNQPREVKESLGEMKNGNYNGVDSDAVSIDGDLEQTADDSSVMPSTSQESLSLTSIPSNKTISEWKVKKGRSWRQEDMNAALQVCREQGVSATAAAKTFNVPRKTLTDRLSGKRSDDCRMGAPTALSKEQEATLCKYIEYMAQKGFPLTVNQIIMYAWSIDKCGGRKVFGESGPCYGWWVAFKRRHPETAKLRRSDKLRQSDSLNEDQALSSATDTLKTYFHLLKQAMDEGKFHERPQDIYNCDETVVNLNKSSQEVVIPRRVKKTHSRQLIASSQHITIHSCISAAGFVMPPYIIFKSAFPGGNYTEDGPHRAMYAKQDLGFMDSKHFLNWFEKIFIPHAQPTPERSVLLLLDGHLTHCSIPVIETAKRNNVILMALSPLTTRLCQPLDVAVYKSFKPKLIELIERGKANRGDLWISKKKFPKYIKPPLEESMSPSNITTGFRTCGIFPFNSSALDKTQLPEDIDFKVPVSINAAQQNLPSDDKESLGETENGDCSGVDSDAASLDGDLEQTSDDKTQLIRNGLMPEGGIDFKFPVSINAAQQNQQRDDDESLGETENANCNGVDSDAASLDGDLEQTTDDSYMLPVMPTTLKEGPSLTSLPSNAAGLNNVLTKMTERGNEGKHSFTKAKSHKRKQDFEGIIKQEDQYGEDPDTSHFRNLKRHKKGGEKSNKRRSFHRKNYFIQIPKPENPRKYTVSIAVPASILDATSVKDELRTYVVGQIARAAVIYSIDEIVVYDDGYWPKTNPAEQKNYSQMALDKMKILLEYQELPQYLRKYFFGFNKHLRCVGLLNPLNSSHHLKFNEWCEYREGVVLEESDNLMSYVDVGLNRNILIDQKLEPGLRVTVKLPTVAQEMDDPCGTVVSPDEPRVKKGYYWGYQVRVANSLSEVVTGCKFPDGYDLIIGTSDKGDDARKAEYPNFSHALIVFGGVEGLEAAIEADCELQATEPLELFHFYNNTCLLQQVRTIRTEEAVLISLCVLHDKLCSKGIQ